MKKKMFLAFMAFATLAMVGFTSCSKDAPTEVGGDMINPMPSESDIIGTWKVTNVTKGETFQQGQILVINADHTISYYHDYHFYGDWKLDKYNFEAQLEGSAYRYLFVFNMSLIKGEDHKIKVNGYINLFGDEVLVRFEDVQFILEPLTSLSDIRQAAKDGFDCSKYLGQYVDASGNLTPNPLNAIGRVAYVSEKPVDVDASAVETRILVLALTDVGSFQWKKTELAGESAYNDPNVMCGLDFCSKYNNESYPAAYATYNWDAGRPSGSTNWFLPSQAQWNKMLGVAKMDGTGQMSTGRYWAANESSNALLTNSAMSYDFETGSWQEMIKIAELKVRACFAY